MTDIKTMTDDETIERALEILKARLAYTTGTVGFSNSETTKEFLKLRLAGREHEVGAFMFLTTQNRLIAYEEMFHGTIDRAAIHPREVVKRALFHNAAGVIMAHNHPSSNATPSPQDHAITQKLGEALQLVDIRLLDHIIVGVGPAVSLKELGF